MEGEQIQMHDLFVFEQTGVDENGARHGQFVCTGIRPQVRRANRASRHSTAERLFLRRVFDS